MSNTILLNNRPEGKPQESDFKFVEQEVGTPNDGELLVESLYVSVDPYLRGRMRDEESYIPPFELNEPMASSIVAKVLKSKDSNFNEGDYVTGNMPWKKKQVIKAEEVQAVDEEQADLSAYLGILGLTGLTAYIGLTEIGESKEGETLVVSGAAGAVGSVVGQIGKIMGLKVVGIAGTDKKIEMLKSKFGFDEGINYKTNDNMQEAIAKACPDGVDVYFDNVGGEISDAVLFNINEFARMVICGAIAVYNETSVPKGVAVQPFLVKKSAKMQGFIVRNHTDKFKDARKQLAKWLQENKLTYEETIREGFENIPQAFLDLFEGKNKGKMVVKVSE